MEWEGPHICPYCEGEDTVIHHDGTVECHECGFIWQVSDDTQPQRHRPGNANTKYGETDAARVILSVLLFVAIVASIVIMACC